MCVILVNNMCVMSPPLRTNKSTPRATYMKSNCCGHVHEQLAHVLLLLLLSIDNLFLLS